MEVYKHDSYDSYRDAQIRLNKRKLKRVWAQKAEIEQVVSYLVSRKAPLLFGLCHAFYYIMLLN